MFMNATGRRWKIICHACGINQAATLAWCYQCYNRKFYNTEEDQEIMDNILKDKFIMETNRF